MICFPHSYFVLASIFDDSDDDDVEITMLDQEKPKPDPPASASCKNASLRQDRSKVAAAAEVPTAAKVAAACTMIVTEASSSLVIFEEETELALSKIMNEQEASSFMLPILTELGKATKAEKRNREKDEDEVFEEEDEPITKYLMLSEEAQESSNEDLPPLLLSDRPFDYSAADLLDDDPYAANDEFIVGPIEELRDDVSL